MKEMDSFNVNKNKYTFSCDVCGNLHTVNVPQRICESIGVCSCGNHFELQVKHSNPTFEVNVRPLGKWEEVSKILEPNSDIEIFYL